MTREHKKILFRFYSDILEQEIAETLWALPVDENPDHYRIDSIPFYTPMVASDDIVFAEYDDTEEMLTYREPIQRSGNSIIWVVIVDEEADIEHIREVFYDMGCDSEALGEKFFAMEVRAETNYLKIRNKLNEYRSEGKIDYAEPNLSAEHQY